MGFSNLGIATPSNAAATIEATKDISNTAEGQEQRLVGKHGPTNQNVQASSAKNDLLDALEELGMAASAKRKVDIDKIKVRKGAGTDLDAIGRISEYLEKLPNLPKDQQLRDLVQKFAAFEESFRQGEGGGLPTPDDLRKALAAYDGDVSHRFAVLETITAEAIERGAPKEYVETLNALRREMRQPEVARDIVAGFHAAPMAARLAEQTGGDSGDFREAYRQMLREGTRPIDVFVKLQSFSLTESLEKVIDGFIRVAGDDMRAFGSSAEPAHLNAVVKELSRLKQFRTVLDKTSVALANIGANIKDKTGWPSTQELATRLLRFAGQPVPSVEGAKTMLQGFGEDPADLRVRALNQIRIVHADIPKDLMPLDPMVVQQKSVLGTVSDREVEAEELRFAAAQ